MEPTRAFGKTEVNEVLVLPDLAFDLSEGKPLPEKLGKADVPVYVLADMAFDLQALPILQVTVLVQPEATATQIGYDLYRLYVALNQLDLSLSGSGVTPAEESPPATANGSCTLTFKPNRPEGAAQRFTEAANLINDSPQTATWLPTPLSALAGYHAKTAGPGA